MQWTLDNSKFLSTVNSKQDCWALVKKVGLLPFGTAPFTYAGSNEVAPSSEWHFVNPDSWFKVKSSTCYTASYIRRTQNQKRFTILEVAADWHELMIPQRTTRPSIARMNEQLNPRFAANRHTIAPNQPH